jgi:hypothetical protein
MRTQVVEMRTAIRALALSAVICGVAGNSPLVRAQDVSLEMRTKDGGSKYHLGESIDVQLVFSSTSKQYIVDSSFSYPELQTAQDEFLVEPKGGSEDPMEDYRRALSSNQYFGFMSRMRGIARLGDKPVVLDLPLNRYVRFTKPGQYVLRLSDRRVSHVRTSIEEPSQVLETAAQPLRLTILAADVAWQKEQLSFALEALKKGPGVNVHACEILESLGTLESELAMADALADEKVAMECSFSYSLLSARNRKMVLERMQQNLESPAGKINPGFVEMMATLRTLEEHPETEFYQRQAEARKGVSDALFAVLDEKKGPARIAAISTLVNESLMVAGNENSGRDTQVLRLAAEAFAQLNAQAQSTLLSAKWSQIAGPAMVPVLRRCAEADSTEICGYVQGELLLARLNELSPGDAREVILADVQKESPRFPSRLLAMLPDHQLSELDGVLREHLASKTANLDTTAGLIQRYATGGISGAVLQFLKENEPGKLGGEIEPNLIAYLFRVQPDAAEQKLRAALAAREGTAVYKYLLREVAQRSQDAKLQPIAIEALGDADSDVVLSAVQALGFVGDERGKAALFRRLEEWSAKWMGQQDRLLWIPGDEPMTDDRYLGNELMRAIGTGDGWLMTAEDAQRLLKTAVDQNLKETAKQYIEAAKERPVPITVNDAGSPNVQIIAGQYSYETVARLKRKLAQFPAGTSFAMPCALAGTATETRKAIAEIEAHLTHSGMRVGACK